MRKYQLQLALYAVLALFTITSCQKDGSEGTAGPEGPPGPQGVPGVANVIYSDWLDVEFDTYSSPAPVDTTYYATIVAPKLTADIINKGEVKVYVNIGGAEPAIVALPFINPGGIIINATYYEGNIELFSNIPASTFTDDGEKILQYRYVLIPGGVLAVKPNDVRLENYNELQKYLKLKD